MARGQPLGAAGPRTFTADPAQSRALIDVGKSGAFSFAGHTHEVEAPLTSGVIHLDADDPSHDDVRLEFNAAAMRVTGKGESASDVPKVTTTMLGDMVLDVERYPSIAFESTGVTAKGPAAALDLSVTGSLTIHGKTQSRDRARFGQSRRRSDDGHRQVRHQADRFRHHAHLRRGRRQGEG